MDDLNYKRVVTDLDAYHVTYVLTGSVAAALPGSARSDLIATISPTAQKHIERRPHIVEARQHMEAGALPGLLDTLARR